MPIGFVIRKNQYYDSVFLMRVASNLAEKAGVLDCAALMGTDANKEQLISIGVREADLAAAGPNDLVIAIVAENAALLERHLGEIDQHLAGAAQTTKASTYGSIAEAARAFPQSNLVVISVPGDYAAREAHKALEEGKHVFLFSDNVTLEQEVELKQFARSRRRLVMGPDCGTSLVGGVGIGFANRVRRGPVGVVGAAGTGIQEFTSLVHQASSGISHAIGTGSHDLSDAVGAITTLMGLDVLEADPATRVITVISKPAGEKTLPLLSERIRRCRKPVVGCILGLDRPMECGPNFHQVGTIDHAVQQALACIAGKEAGKTLKTVVQRNTSAGQTIPGWLPEQRYLRGLFAGGTFCFQTQQVLQKAGISVFSNTPLDTRYHLENPDMSLEHSLIDMGDDYFTRGRPHPMIDASERRKRILQEAGDPEVAVLLLDFILGDMASPDPVGDLIGTIRQAIETVSRRGGCLVVAASICGTDLDAQGLDLQRSRLLNAGVNVFASSTQAAEFCRGLIQKAGELSHG